MSLVAYGASSDEESDEELGQTVPEVLKNGREPKTGNKKNFIDDEDKWSDTEENYIAPVPKKNLNLPAPHHEETIFISEDDTQENIDVPKFDKLPPPKPVQIKENSEVDEADDEFLHKKEVPPKDLEKPARSTVKITIPSLSEFKDLDESKTNRPSTSKSIKKSGLLGILPKPKDQVIYSKADEHGSSRTNVSKSAALIPDSVKSAQLKSQAKAANAKVLKSHMKSQTKKKPKVIPARSDSEESDNEAGDFFSLNSKTDNLPTVCESEINVMVAKRAAQMAEASSRIDAMLTPAASQDHQEAESASANSSNNVNIDDQAIHALVGRRAKRAKMNNINVVELSAAEVLPDKDEWLRTALASSTDYQAKGVLVDEEPAPGTRKKHQITYLAHQAKANEQELQAMWSANRHTRRQTQSKYGF